jgi:hypothetical protein
LQWSCWPLEERLDTQKWSYSSKYRFQGAENVLETPREEESQGKQISRP